MVRWGKHSWSSATITTYGIKGHWRQHKKHFEQFSLFLCHNTVILLLPFFGYAKCLALQISYPYNYAHFGHICAPHRLVANIYHHKSSFMTQKGTKTQQKKRQWKVQRYHSRNGCCLYQLSHTPSRCDNKERHSYSDTMHRSVVLK